MQFGLTAWRERDKADMRRLGEGLGCWEGYRCPEGVRVGMISFSCSLEVESKSKAPQAGLQYGSCHLMPDWGQTFLATLHFLIMMEMGTRMGTDGSF